MKKFIYTVYNNETDYESGSFITKEIIYLPDDFKEKSKKEIIDLILSKVQFIPFNGEINNFQVSETDGQFHKEEPQIGLIESDNYFFKF